ncbi:MAG: hypothetical protein R3344_03410 [Acidobacteriota bacterium]|nr:hypothetical protein [Acidobacteriota bacterium]
MAFQRTSRTLLAERVVRVDRRIRMDDGAYGTVARYQTIIQRYWCTIYPAHHQERRREDLGEAPTGNLQTHFAIADPSRNGQSIMVGDRFIDEVNNITYEVLGAERPRHHSPYSAMHRYALLVCSDPQAEVVS